MDRRAFLKLMGLGAATTAAGLIVPELLKPERRFWQVSRNAPVAGIKLHGSDWRGAIWRDGTRNWPHTAFVSPDTYERLQRDAEDLRRIGSKDIWIADDHGFTFSPTGEAYNLNLGSEHFGFSVEAMKYPRAIAETINQLSQHARAEVRGDNLIVSAVDVKRRTITLTGVGR